MNKTSKCNEEAVQGGGGIEQKGKRTHGHGQQSSDCWGEGGTRGLNGNGKHTIKNRKKLCSEVC